MKKRSLLPILMIVLGAVIVFTAVIVSLQPRAQAQTPTPQPLVSEEESFPEVPRVSLEEALSANKSGSAVFIDVRDRSAYEAEHIPGSLSFPLAQLDSQLKELDPNAWIITYCT
jgi:3-mercaptopyruvate sulfurtransferase SseA